MTAKRRGKAGFIDQFRDHRWDGIGDKDPVNHRTGIWAKKDESE
jgi:hypothetical protein